MLGDAPRETQSTLGELFDLTHPDERSLLLASYTAALKGEAPEYKTEHRVRTRDGEWKWILSHGKVVERAADGYALRIIGTNADITERRRAEDQIRESEQRFRDVVEASGEYVWETDADWRYRYLSKRAEAVLGHPIEALMGRRACELMPADEAHRVTRWLAEHSQPDGAFSNLEHRTLTANGDTVWQWVSGKPVRDEHGTIVAYRGTGANITGRKRHEARIAELATRDPLTGLPNRSLLQDRLMHAVAAERRQSGLVAAMFIDIDRFKTINDSLGHHVGDALLKQVAARLGACLRDKDTVARPGGDEFVVVAAGLRHTGDAQRIARKILLRMNEPFAVGGHQLVITCSIGISLFPTDGEDLDLLLRQADTAMYHAKEAGGNALRFFASEMNARAVERLSLENDLRHALERGALALHYQPVVRLGSGAIVGVEALARWRHPERGMVPPARFIAIAEETGLHRASGRVGARDCVRAGAGVACRGTTR